MPQASTPLSTANARKALDRFDDHSLYVLFLHVLINHDPDLDDTRTSTYHDTRAKEVRGGHWGVLPGV